MDVDGDAQSGDYGSSQSVEEGQRQTDRQKQSKRQNIAGSELLMTDQRFVRGAVAPLSGEMC